MAKSPSLPDIYPSLTKISPMKANLTNLKFEYLYRDAGNYKKFGSMVFENPSGITAEEATELIRSKLIDGQYFESSKGDVPIIHVYV